MSRIKKLRPIYRNKLWWMSDLAALEKVWFYNNIVVSHARHVITRKKYIKYLGKELAYDNIATPLCLLTYPYEISYKIKANISSDINSVLDIGGNLGQFSLTIKRIVNPKIIDVFEPNSVIFDMLEKNLSDLPGVNVYNLGVGDPSDQVMYFEEGRSGLGSLVKDNVERSTNFKKTHIRITDDIPKITGRSKYDLVKIDVEGYEATVLKNLKGISCNYLFIELSGSGRKAQGQHSELLNTIQRQFGDFDILHISEANVTSPSFEVLLKMKKARPGRSSAAVRYGSGSSAKPKKKTKHQR